MTKQERVRAALSKVSFRIAGTIGLLLVFSGLVIGARLWWVPAVAVASLKPATTTAQSTAQTGPINVVLGQHGFVPASVVHTSGAFNLVVENQSGVEVITLRLRRDGVAGQVGEWMVPSGTQTWNQTVELASGGYMLSEVNNPAWLFHITVQ
jgi:hypothetical protein